MSATVHDVFLSYASQDRDRASYFAAWFESLGWSVWWDQTIPPGHKWDETIERELGGARCVVVLWSERSIRSDWVKTEAAEAVRRGILIPVLIDRVEIPLEFRRLQTLNLARWTGHDDEPELDLLRRTVSERIQRPPAPLIPRSKQGRRKAMVAVAVLAVLLGPAGLYVWERAGTQDAPATPTPKPPLASAIEPPPPAPPVPAQPVTTPTPPPPKDAKAGQGHTSPVKTADTDKTPQLVRAGSELAAASESLRQELFKKADESSYFWPYVLERDGGTLLLEQATLLALESVRRGDQQGGNVALRRALTLLSRPARSFAHEDVEMVAVGPDGRRLATAGRDGTAALWEIGTGRELARLKHQDEVLHVAFSPDGKNVVTASADKTVRLWDTATGRELARMSHPTQATWAVFREDGGALGTLSDRSAHIWTLPDGRELQKLDHTHYVTRALFSRDGAYLITAFAGGAEVQPATVWDAKSGQRMTQLTGQDGPIRSIAMSSKVLAIGQHDLVSLWHVGVWSRFGSITGRAPKGSVAFSPDGSLITMGGESARYGPVLVNPVVEGDAPGKIVSQRKNSGAYYVAFSNDGAYVVAVSRDLTAQVLSARTGEEMLRARLRDGAHLSKSPAVFTPDGRYLAMVGETGADIWEISPKDLPREACARLTRNLTPEEWQKFVGSEPYRKTCPALP